MSATEADTTKVQNNDELADLDEGDEVEVNYESTYSNERKTFEGEVTNVEVTDASGHIWVEVDVRNYEDNERRRIKALPAHEDGKDFLVKTIAYDLDTGKSHERKINQTATEVVVEVEDDDANEGDDEDDEDTRAETRRVVEDEGVEEGDTVEITYDADRTEGTRTVRGEVFDADTVGIGIDTGDRRVSARSLGAVKSYAGGRSTRLGTLESIEVVETEAV